MQILWDMTANLHALTGGLLIGLAASIFILFNGRIAGISGVFAGLLSNATIKQGWRIAFLIGLILAPILYIQFFTLPSVTLKASPSLTILAGLLVGVGTRLGNGCTSGHGVCGIARLSKRSIIATMTFMLTGMLTVYVTQHMIGTT